MYCSASVSKYVCVVRELLCDVVWIAFLCVVFNVAVSSGCDLLREMLYVLVCVCRYVCVCLFNVFVCVGCALLCDDVCVCCVFCA